MSLYISIGRVSEALLLLQAIDKFACSCLSEVQQLTVTYGINREEAIKFSKQCGWIDLNGSQIRLTDNGFGIIRLFSGTHISQQLWLHILHTYIVSSFPSWSSRIPFGRKEAFLFMSTEEKRCFNEAGLMDGTTDVIVDWWDALATMIRKDKEEGKSNTGRRGEKLTMSYEKNRTGRSPFWESIESNLAGYDIISSESSENEKQILIEVKSTSGDFSHSELIITRNEWDVASTPYNLDKYFFYLWDLSDKPRLAIVKPQEMIDHIPVDSGAGKWKETRVPFNLFGEKFFLL